MAKSFYRATLTGRKPFSSFTIPGTNPTVVVGRAGALLDAETAAKLKKALKEKSVPNVTADDVTVDQVDGPSVSADTSEDLAAVRAEADALRTHSADVLNTLTVAQLTDLAGRRNVTVESGANKEDIVSALLAPAEPSR